LLGDEQSGQIHSVGFSLYMDMLHRAVDSLKRGEIPDVDAPLDQGTEVNLHLPALIPDDYLPDVNSRLILYKRIAAAANDGELRELQVEMIDRFGLLPAQVSNLFLVSRLRLKAQDLGIRTIEAGPEGGSIDFKETTRVNPMSLVRLVQTDPLSYKLAGATRLRFEQHLPDSLDRQQYLEELLQTFATEATEDAA
jgi:transcription-repair coupling factor (superfamily II helicase)